jgi:predicted nucleotidyltransferase component of viral defense system
MKLHEKPDEFKTLVELTSQELEIRQVYVEKDYWLTFVLKELSKSKFSDDVVFKGGTSLSKAFKIVDRFSEDIDLVLLSKDGMNGNQIKKLLYDIEKNIIILPIESDPQFKSSKGSKIRKTGYKYPRLIDEKDFGHAVDTLILELNAFANPYPVKKMQIQSYIADFLNKNNDKESVHAYELEPFSVYVLDVSRTFAEKVLSLARVSDIDDEKLSETKAKIRHFYDIHKIMESGVLKDFLTGEEFTKTLKLVLKDDLSNPEFKDDWKDGALKDVKLFKNMGEILTQLESTFNQDFKTLLYRPEEEKFDAIKKSFSRLVEYLPDIDVFKIKNL